MQNNKNLVIIIVAVVVAILAYGMLTMPDRRTTGEKIEDAVDQLKDRTPGEKVGDAVEDVGESIKRNTNN